MEIPVGQFFFQYSIRPKKSVELIQNKSEGISEDISKETRGPVSRINFWEISWETHGEKLRKIPEVIPFLFFDKSSKNHQDFLE